MGRVKGELSFMAWLTGCTPKYEPMRSLSMCSRNSEARETLWGRMWEVWSVRVSDFRKEVK